MRFAWLKGEFHNAYNLCRLPRTPSPKIYILGNISRCECAIVHRESGLKTVAIDIEKRREGYRQWLSMKGVPADQISNADLDRFITSTRRRMYIWGAVILALLALAGFRLWQGFFAN
jgi:hypothetical protein